MTKTPMHLQDLRRRIDAKAKAEPSWRFRRHLMRARKRRGFGWKRWSRQWLYQRLGLFNHYRVHRPRLKALPTG
jgi:hypothetical protein